MFHFTETVKFPKTEKVKRMFGHGLLILMVLCIYRLDVPLHDQKKKKKGKRETKAVHALTYNF